MKEEDPSSVNLSASLFMVCFLWYVDLNDMGVCTLSTRNNQAKNDKAKPHINIGGVV
jgi:hypothetical protein